MFVRALAKEDSDPIKALEGYLLERGWPDDHRFEAAFVEFPLYQRGYTQEVLETLERARGHKEPADLKKAQVEHIMPQTLSDAWRQALGPEAELIHADWLHRPGNLTLTAYNRDAWNYPFETKREIYDDSHIELTKELVAYERWTDVEIQQRGRLLAGEAARIWIGPKEQVVPGAANAPGTGTKGSGLQKSSDTIPLQLEYWQEFQSVVGERSKVIKARKAQPQHWASFALGRSDFSLQAAVSRRNRKIMVFLEISGPNAKTYFRLLLQQSDDIEREIGEPLTWWELPEKIRSYISLYRYDLPLEDRQSWPAQHEWLLEKLELFHRTFAQRVKSLDASTVASAGTP